ncbi:DivIVA domain-containing protein [Micromonospora sp. NPDC050980]|uniref:DivIVA domain-containing protein n=1 Tax=Micromonospora sp. NPDC050980 TaxID=3155161 RepID=UPI0033D5A8EA
MRVFFRRRERAERPRPVGGSTCYRSASCRPLHPTQVRQRNFRWTRRGLDPDEVRLFLERVACELSEAHDALVRSQEEYKRIRDALRDWQSEQSRVHLAELQGSGHRSVR